MKIIRISIIGCLCTALVAYLIMTVVMQCGARVHSVGSSRRRNLDPVLKTQEEARSQLMGLAEQLYSDRDFAGALRAMEEVNSIHQSLYGHLFTALLSCEMDQRESAIANVEAFFAPDKTKRWAGGSPLPAALMTLAQNMDRFGRPDLADKCLDRMLRHTDDWGEMPKDYWNVAEKFPCKTREDRFNRGYALASGWTTFDVGMLPNGHSKSWPESHYWPEVNLNTNDPIVLYIRGGRRGYGQATPFEKEANFRKLLDIVKDDMPFRKKCWGGLLAAIYQQRPYDRKKYRYWQKIACAETGEPFHEDQPGVLTGPRPGEKFVLREEIKKQWESMHK